MVEDSGRVQRTLKVPMGEFGQDLLRAHGASGKARSSHFNQAVYYYLQDAQSGRAAWPYPRLDGLPADDQVIDVLLEVRDATWNSFTLAAEHQGVTVEQLLRHAALYFAADIESGRVTARILDDLVED